MIANPPTTASFLAGLIKTAAAAAVLVCMTSGVLAQDDSMVTQTAVAATTGSKTRPGSDLSDVSDTTHTILILGERVGLNGDAPQKKPFPDLVAASSQVLGTDVSEFTIPEATLPSTADAVKSGEAPADIVIILGGHSDEVKKVADDDIRTAILNIGESLRQRNPDIKIFLVPSATFVSTLTSARMRLAAEEAGINFVPLGTEVSGEPHVQAMMAIRAELTNEPESAAVSGRPAPAPDDTLPPVAESTPSPTPAAATATPAGTAQPAEASGPDTADYQARQSSLQRELDRIAGETEDSSIMPADVSTLTTAPGELEPSPARETMPPGGTLTKRGAEATETITMRSLPALKAYRPQIPVPRNRIDKKEPALDR